VRDRNAAHPLHAPSPSPDSQKELEFEVPPPGQFGPIPPPHFPPAITSTITVESQPSRTPAKPVTSTVVVVTSDAPPRTTVYSSTSTLSTITTTITSSASASSSCTDEKEKPHRTKHHGYHSSKKGPPGVGSIPLHSLTYPPVATTIDRAPTWVNSLGPIPSGGQSKCGADDENCPYKAAGNESHHEKPHHTKPAHYSTSLNETTVAELTAEERKIIEGIAEAAAERIASAVSHAAGH
jgi:hypothetical protein